MTRFPLWTLVREAAAAVHHTPRTLLALALPALLAAWVAGAASHGSFAARLDHALPRDDERTLAAFDDPPGVFPSGELLERLHGGTASGVLAAVAASGLGATLLAAGLALALLHGPLQCGALSALRARSRGGPAGLLAATARLAWPATALSALAAIGYGACLWSIDRLGALLQWLATLLPAAWVAWPFSILAGAARLGLLLAGLFVVRSLLDLSRASLVEAESRGWLRPAALALRHLPALAWPLAGLYLVYWLARLGAFALAYPIGAASGGSWAGLALGFVVQQAIAGSLAGVRLLRLETVRRLLAAHQARLAPPAYKLEAPGSVARS